MHFVILHICSQDGEDHGNDDDDGNYHHHNTPTIQVLLLLLLLLLLPPLPTPPPPPPPSYVQPCPMQSLYNVKYALDEEGRDRMQSYFLLKWIL